PPFGADRPLPTPALTASKLPNGLTVWLVARPGFPKITAVLAVRGGSAADPKDHEGISELLAATLKEGTVKRTARQIAEQLQSAGGSIDGSDSDDALYLTVDGLSSGAATVLDILSDVARNASFPPAEVELAKANAIQGLLARTSTPEFLGTKAFARAIYGDHPYHTVAPTKEVLEAATPALLKQEFARRFRPEGSLLVIVGDIDPAATGKLVTKAFGSWKGTGEAPGATAAPPPAAGRRFFYVNRPGSVQSLILVGRPTITVTNPDYYPLLVANTICAGSFTSRLTENIREDKGYTYSPRGTVQALQEGGLLRVRADVRNDVTGATLNEIFYEMDRMATTNPTDEELSRAKRYQTGLYLLRNQIQGAVARTLAANWVDGLPPEALGDFVPRIKAVTADQVRAIGVSVYPSAAQTVVLVGDGTVIKKELQPFGTPVALEP
ncbi:MAG TPA: pitrilysin family protein, partial [Candidatus Polarisedimenticolia bacterium]|nr:pitrilysin family protein [Candidatus Polarisedimenticolia bacterium]